MPTHPQAAAAGGPDIPPSDQPGPYAPFAYLSAPNAALYRRVMRAMVAEKERFTVHVRPEQVHAVLRADGGAPVTEEAVADALEQLSRPSWGNLLAFPDSSRVTALEDFYRRRLLYQISREGEAAERALSRYDEALGTRGALQAVALEDIVVLLTGLRDRVRQHATGSRAEVDDAAVHADLRSLRGCFTELAENAVVFMGSVQRTIDLHDADVEAFLAYKERLIEYLEKFIDDLVTRGARIAGLLAEIPPDGVELLCAVAGARESRDAVPGEEDEAVAAATEVWRRQWSGLTDWFVDAPGRDCEAKLLRARARSAIPALLAVVRALHERGGARTDRSLDFVTLARWFATLPDDGARHRLWRTAFGLTPARHLTVPHETVDAWEAAELGNVVAWADAPPVQVSAQLRRTGSYERRGKASRVADRSAQRAYLLARAREENEQTAAARRRVLTDGPRRLSELGELDPVAFRLFLGLLGDALGALRPDRSSSSVQTSDGELRITLTRADDDRTATLRTPDGDLTGPDVLVHVESTHPAPQHLVPEVRDERAATGAPSGTVLEVVHA